MLILKPRKIKAIRQLTIVKPIIPTVYPTLEDAWITGLTDSEGCFHVMFRKTTNSFVIGYHLNQKGDSNKLVLECIRDLFGVGAVRPHYKAYNWAFIISGLRPCSMVQAYLEKYRLLSKKRYSFEKWQKILLALKAKKH